MEKFTTVLESKDGKSRLLSCKDYVKDPEYYYIMCKTLDLNFEPEIFVHGRTFNQKRNVGFYSDESEGYKYSGQISKSKRLFERPWIWMLMDSINKDLGTNFNGVLINEYVSGNNYISPHSDDERSLD